MRQICPILGRETVVEPTGYGRDGWALVRCSETGMVFLPNPPAYEELESAFAWESTILAERDRRLQDEPVFGRLSAAVKRVRMKVLALSGRNKMGSLALAHAARWPSGERIELVDFGCASCVLLVRIVELMRSHGRACVPVGIEVSRRLSVLGNLRLAPLGGRVLFANAVDGASRLAPSSVHLALMSSFLEHEARPLQLLRSLRTALRPDGAVVIKVPNFGCLNRSVRGGRWCGFRYPDHVNYFTPRTLARVASEAGYRVLRQSPWDRLPTSDNMYMVIGPA